jgi:hypothetical protein
MEGIKQYQAVNSNKTKSLRASVSMDEKFLLERICSILDVPESQIIRDSVREKVAYLIQNHPKVREAFQN